MKSGEWVPHDRISALIRDSRGFPFSLSTMRGCSENVAGCKPGRGHLPGTELAGTRTLDFPASITVRNKFLLLFHPVSGSLLLQPELTNPAPLPRTTPGAGQPTTGDWLTWELKGQPPCPKVGQLCSKTPAPELPRGSGCS